MVFLRDGPKPFTRILLLTQHVVQSPLELGGSILTLTMFPAYDFPTVDNFLAFRS